MFHKHMSSFPLTFTLLFVAAIIVPIGSMLILCIEASLSGICNHRQFTINYRNEVERANSNHFGPMQATNLTFKIR